MDELARSEFYVDLTEIAEDIVKPIVGSSNVYERSLREAIVSVLRVATIIPLSSNVMHQALEFQGVGKISSQDAVVLASVVLFMRERTEGSKVSATRNLKDFVAPAMLAHFCQCDCRLLNSFTAARHLAEATLARWAS